MVMHVTLCMQAGEEEWGTDEAAINKILSLRNYAQLRATFDAYVGISGKDIEEAIESETSGSLQDGMLAISEHKLTSSLPTTI